MTESVRVKEAAVPGEQGTGWAEALERARACCLRHQVDTAVVNGGSAPVDLLGGGQRLCGGSHGQGQGHPRVLSLERSQAGVVKQSSAHGNYRVPEAVGSLLRDRLSSSAGSSFPPDVGRSSKEHKEPGRRHCGCHSDKPSGAKAVSSAIPLDSGAMETVLVLRRPLPCLACLVELLQS